MANRRNPGGGGGKSTTSGYSPEDSSILALVEGRGQARGEVGIASMDLHTSKLIICQFSDTQNYTKVLSKLNIFRPVEILLPSTICDDQMSRLYQQIQQEFISCTIVPLQRRVFNEVVGKQRLQELVLEECASVLYAVSQKYYGLSAAAALLKYIEIVRNILFSPRTMKIEFQLAEKTVMIDRYTAQHLELIQNNLIANSDNSLYGVVNNCRTPSGSRLLRTNILQPPCDTGIIKKRLDCIQELRNNPIMHYELVNALSQLPQDLEHVIATLTHISKVENARVMEQRINYVIFLKQTLTVLPGLADALGASTHPYFHSVKDDFMCPKFEKIAQKIQTVITDDARSMKGGLAMRMQRSFAVKADINSLLSIARKAMCEIQDDTFNYVVQLAKDNDLNLRLQENSSRGFYVQLMIPGRVWDIPHLPDTALNVAQKKNIVTFTTEYLLLAEQRISKILEEIHNISSLIIAELVNNIRQDIGTLYKASDAVSELDILCSLTSYSVSTVHVVRPQFSSTVTAITMGRHPILDSISTTSPTPNNFFMSNDTNVSVITGPNMSGKTTFLKQIVSLQILAQIGSFVPAEAATFRIVNRIFSRLGNGDNIEANASSFATEMTEMNYILNNINSQSLVIIDELGRSTSIEEGTAICWSMLESLMKHKCFVLFATHYLFLTKMEFLYLNVLNYKLDTEENSMEQTGNLNNGDVPEANARVIEVVDPKRLIYTHVFKRGVTSVEHYGLKLARNSSFPEVVVQRAMTLAKGMMELRKRSIHPIRNADIVESHPEPVTEDPTNSGASTERSNTRNHMSNLIADESDSAKQTKYLLTSHLYILATSEAAKKLSPIGLYHYLSNLQDEYILTFMWEEQPNLPS